MDDEQFEESLNRFKETYKRLKKHDVGHYEMAVRMASAFVLHAETILFDMKIRRPFLEPEENPVLAKITWIRNKLAETAFTFGTLFDDVKYAKLKKKEDRAP